MQKPLSKTFTAEAEVISLQQWDEKNKDCAASKAHFSECRDGSRESSIKADQVNKEPSDVSTNVAKLQSEADKVRKLLTQCQRNGPNP